MEELEFNVEGTYQNDSKTFTSNISTDSKRANFKFLAFGLKYLVYDRLNDKLTVYRNFRSSVDISFSKGYGVRVYTAVRPGTINQHLTFVSSKEKSRVGGIITELQVDLSWSFTVWYMDKNRPLPPGTAFDAYREKDFERRKAEGFPKPLYKSTIPTPEATPEQQLVREAFWKDEDYIVDAEEAYYNAESISEAIKTHKKAKEEKRKQERDAFNRKIASLSKLSTSELTSYFTERYSK